MKYSHVLIETEKHIDKGWLNLHLKVTCMDPLIETIGPATKRTRSLGMKDHTELLLSSPIGQ